MCSTICSLKFSDYFDELKKCFSMFVKVAYIIYFRDENDSLSSRSENNIWSNMP